jgi:hypothetical protein
MCQCYQIGGPFIAEDPDCEVHGREAQRAAEDRDVLIERLTLVSRQGSETEIWQGLIAAIEYLRTL